MAKVQKAIALWPWSSTARPIAVFWYNLKMLIILKTFSDRAILSKFWTLWTLETLNITTLKKFMLNFPNFAEIENVNYLKNHYR